MNFITRKSFDGLELDARYGLAGTYRSFDANATAGRKWAAGSAFVSYNYSQHGAFHGRDRDYVRQIPVEHRRRPLPGNRPSLLPGNVQLVPAGTIYALPYHSATAVPIARTSATRATPSTFYPSEHRHSAMAGLTQQLGNAAKLDLRGFYMDRKMYQSGGRYTSTQFLGPAAFGLTPSPFMAAHRYHQSGRKSSGQLRLGRRRCARCHGSLETWGWRRRHRRIWGAAGNCARWPATAGARPGRRPRQSAGTRCPMRSGPACSIPTIPRPAIRRRWWRRRPGNVRPVPPAADQCAAGRRWRSAVSLPGGAVKLAAGAEYLQEKLRSQKGQAVPGIEDSGSPDFRCPPTCRAIRSRSSSPRSPRFRSRA